MSYSSGKYAYGICDISGFRYKLKDMKKTWDGLLVGPDQWSPKHPQLDPPHTKADAIALRNPRVQKFQQPTTVASNDVTVADSGGITVGVANLTLPGDFAFNNQGTSEMKPADPSLQNRRRQVTALVNPVTIGIS